jgi:hypothetical protein
MRFLFVLTFLSINAFANYISSPTSPTYWDKATCELKEGVTCYSLNGLEKELIKIDGGVVVLDPIKVAEEAAKEEAKEQKETKDAQDLAALKAKLATADKLTDDEIKLALKLLFGVP